MSIRFVAHIKRSNISETNIQEDRGLFFKGNNGRHAILIHGLTGTPYEVAFLAKFLNKKGYSVTCPRLANHGKPIEILKNTRWQEWYQSVRALFLDIEARAECGQIFVAGLSVAAIFALLLADEFPKSISGVSCLSPTIYYDGWNTSKWKYWLPLVYMTPLKNFFYFKEEPPYGIKNENIRKRVHEYYSNARIEDLENVNRFGYAYYPVALLYQHHLLAKYLSKRLPFIKTPIQIMQAQDDDMSSIRNSQFIYDRIGSNVKTLEMLYDSYHVITADQEREKVAIKVEEFFNKQYEESHHNSDVAYNLNQNNRT